jgi:hypothetical protein
MPPPPQSGHCAPREGEEGALKDYNEAIRLKPDYAPALYNRGAARQRRLEGR